MISGYNRFPIDVSTVFADIIEQYNFRITISEPDAVALVNDKIQIGFSINEEFLNMSIKSGDKFYNVTDIISLLDKNFYNKWNADREAAIKNLSREKYYETYLMYYHQVSNKYFLDTYATGILPSYEPEEANDLQSEKEAAFSIAWNAMQQLDYNDPIRQKYIANDPGWIDDMLKAINKKDNRK